jgi:hypothetical protein
MDMGFMKPVMEAFLLQSWQLALKVSSLKKWDHDWKYFAQRL